LLDRVRFVLVGTTHPGNIGACARAMKNMGLGDLALARPACGLPHPDADALAAGAVELVRRATIHPTLEAAVADCALVVGTSSRRRSLAWPELEPRGLAAAIRALPADARAAVVFGPERIGLDNDELARCTHLVVIPANPEYAALNLAQAAQILAWELRMSSLAPAAPPPAGASFDGMPLASHAELEAYYARLEAALRARGFLAADNPRHLMKRIRRLYGRALPDRNEINILQGMLTALLDDAAQAGKDGGNT
jgi:tRNA/rRNA methyltransferase/tRNA (cytidine32/uridine32-2'-O)-methyltransferase